MQSRGPLAVESDRMAMATIPIEDGAPIAVTI